MSRRPALDLEVVELLADEPELLALADAVVATQPRAQRRRLLPRLFAATVLLATLGAIVLALPGGDGERSTVAQALAAIGTGPVIRARIEARLPATNVVDLATGRATPQTIAIDYWFDEPRSRLRTVVRRSGVVTHESLQTRGALGSQPALDPALAGFVTRYRASLASGEARVDERASLAGRDVVWLVFTARGTRERVAVDAETYTPVVIAPLDETGRRTRFLWRVRRVETLARVEADFAPPRPRPPAPFRGDVRQSRPVSSGQVAARLAWPALWLGQSWRGLRLASLALETLTRGYPPGGGLRTKRGAGLRVRYAVDGAGTYVELLQAPFPEPAYAFTGGRSTFNGNPIPPEGHAELVELAGTGARPAVIGQLRRDGVYVTIWASGRRLALQAARALRPIGTR